MNTMKRIAMVTGIAGALVAAGAAGAAGAAPSGIDAAKPAAHSAFVPPADYVQLIDDTATLTVFVPNTWTDTSTLPGALEGVTVPRITAATDYQVFHDTFDAPGLEYFAIPFAADQQATMTDYGLTGGCDAPVIEPYDDGAFAGLHGIWRNCGETGVPEWHQLVVAPASQAHTLILQIQITSPAEAPVLQNIFDSFNTLGVVGAPTSTVPGAATTPTAPVTTVPGAATTPTAPVVTTVPGGATLPTVPVAPTVPNVPPTVPGVTTSPIITTPPIVPTSLPGIPAGYVRVNDDTQTMSVAIPATWLDVDTTAFVAADAPNSSPAPQIRAATNLVSFDDTFDAPGIHVIQTPFLADSETFVTDNGLTGGCQMNLVEPYTNGIITGHINRFTDCGQSGLPEWDVIVAAPADQSVSYVIVTQSTNPTEQSEMPAIIASIGPAQPATGTVMPTTVPGG